MAKTIVFSWKIDNKKYGYLWVPGYDNPIICNRITTPETLTLISDEVSSWSMITYTEKFKFLKQQIYEYTNGKTINGEASEYFNEGVNNYIVLSGKDGSNSDGSVNGGVDEKTLNMLKKYVDEKIAANKVEVSSEINRLKAETIGKIEVTNTMVSNKIQAAEQMLDLQKTELEDRLLDASRAIEGATKIFDLEAVHITPEKIGEAIEAARDTKIWKDSAQYKLESHEQTVTYCRDKVEENAREVNTFNEKINDYRADAYDRIAQLSVDVSSVNQRMNEMSERVDEIDVKVEKVSPGDISKTEAANNENASSTPEGNETLSRGMKSGSNDDGVSEVESIDNGDGTYDINTTIGGEHFNVRIYGFGKKIKPKDETYKGLLLADNGFRYEDKNGGCISLVNGEIKLSNANGSGKIEIRDDGVYINDVKQ